MHNAFAAFAVHVPLGHGVKFTRFRNIGKTFADCFLVVSCFAHWNLPRQHVPNRRSPSTTSKGFDEQNQKHLYHQHFERQNDAWVLHISQNPNRTCFGAVQELQIL